MPGSPPPTAVGVAGEGGSTLFCSMCSDTKGAGSVCPLTLPNVTLAVITWNSGISGGGGVG